jgi:hypothetical protein
MSATVPAELGAILFASLPRSDQRRKGLHYVQGLLDAQGRKSIRGIAALGGAAATEQNLHHFICDSTWDWMPVRRALADHLAAVAPPVAWLLRPLLIPKAGAHSVGVERCFVPSLGQVTGAQRAVGVWSAGQDVTAPVHWRLHLSAAWLADGRRRARAAVPDGVRAETYEDCVVRAYRDSRAGGPVVLDAREMDATRVIRRLGVPVLARVSGSLPVTAGSRPAADVADLRRGGSVRAVPIRLPRPGLLLAIGPRRSAELWFTDLPDVDPVAAWRLSRLLPEDPAIGDRVGLRDFAGRSFSGWHRHMTLASAAYAVAALAGHHDGAGRRAS